MTAPLAFTIAERDSEFEAIHRLNCRTFVEEIPQHPVNDQLRLVDKFHCENTYAICKFEGCLVGMVAGRAERPFSLDTKIPNLDSYLPLSRNVVELRLLAVEKDYRSGTVFCGLIRLIARHFIQHGFDMAVISGTTRQLRLYSHLGCVPFGPIVGAAEARFQPMYITLDSFVSNTVTMAPSSK
jgi:hypothetical protein